MEINQDKNFLKKKSKKVDQVTDEIRNLVLKMEKTMKENNGVGLAAPQVGIQERIIIINHNDGTKFFINPVILEKSSVQDCLEEGCLSVPGVRLEIKRPISVKAKFLDLDNQEKTIELHGFSARIFQHELDHLNGILITDRIPLKEKIKRVFLK